MQARQRYRLGSPRLPERIVTAAEVREEIEETPCIIKPLKAGLNPICQFLVLLGAHHIFHVSMIDGEEYTHPELHGGH